MNGSNSSFFSIIYESLKSEEKTGCAINIKILECAQNNTLVGHGRHCISFSLMHNIAHPISIQV